MLLATLTSLGAAAAREYTLCEAFHVRVLAGHWGTSAVCCLQLLAVPALEGHTNFGFLL